VARDTREQLARDGGRVLLRARRTMVYKEKRGKGMGCRRFTRRKEEEGCEGCEGRRRAQGGGRARGLEDESRPGLPVDTQYSK
jgi:hypothetical protein